MTSRSGARSHSLCLALSTLLLAATAVPGAAQTAASDPPTAEEDPLFFQAGDFTADLGGYGSFRYELNGSDEVPNSITLRRFVITTDARFGDRLQVYSEVEYERLSEIEVERSVGVEEGGLEFEQELEGTNGSEIAIEQAWGQFNFGRGLGLRFGAVLPPVGRFNRLHDDNLWNFPRRPLADRDANVLPASAAWTEMGLGFVGEASVGESALLTYEAYLLNGTTLDFAIEEKVQTRSPARDKLLLEAVVSPTAGAFDGSNRADAFAGRVALSPALGSEIALSGYTGRYTPAWLEVEQVLTTLGVDGRQRFGRLELEGEFLYTRYDGLEDVATDFARATVNHATETESFETAELESEIEVVLEGLSDERYGYWVDAGLPLALGRGTLGLENAVLIPTVRWEQVWFDQDLAALDFADGAVTALDQVDRGQSRLSLGLAFRPVTQAVFHLTYERNSASDGSLIFPATGEDTTNGLVLGMAVGF